MDFINEIYSNGRAGLVVNFIQTENNSNFCNTDSIKEAMEYFGLYLNNDKIMISCKLSR